MNIYTALLHTHRLVVTLFLIHYVVKLLLLQLNKQEQLAKYTKATRIPEIVLSVLFLITGVWMMAEGALLNNLLLIKIVVVLASIPLAVIGFKRGNKMLAGLSVVFLISAYGLAEMNKASKAGTVVDTGTSTEPLEVGKLVYNEKCVVCHGADGKLMLSGAKDLSMTQLTAAEQGALIRSGKNSMPPFTAEALTDAQLDAVVQYVATLKQ